MRQNNEHEGLLDFLYLCPVGVIKSKLNGAIEMLNPKAAQLLVPLSKGPAKLENLFDALQHHAPEVRHLVSRHTQSHGVVCDQHQIEIRTGAPKGGVAFLALTIIKQDIGEGKLMTVVQDVTTIVEQEHALRSREQRLEAIFNGVRDYAIYSLDETGRIETWNKSAERVEGYSAEQVIGRQYGLDYPGDTRDPLQAAGALKHAAKAGWHEDEGWRVRRDGQRFWANTMISVLRESDDPRSRAQGYSVITRDISDRKEAEDALRRMATTDYLTGLHNRRYFFDNAPGVAARAAARGRPRSVIMIDADGFKRLNDTRGHVAGDRALQALAGILRDLVGTAGIAARFGGEEFAILLPDANLKAAEAMAGNIRRSVEEAEIGCTVSLGVAEVADDVEAALRLADHALYDAKAGGRNRVVVCPGLNPGV